MISLTDPIVNGLQLEFNNLDNSYKDTIVKEIYKPLPKGHYPKVIVQEIRNRERTDRSTASEEQTIALGYQITCYTRDTEEYDYVDGVKYMIDLVNDYITTNFKVQRVGDYAIMPYISDNTVMTCNVRYNCVYDKETQLIYTN